MLNIGKASCTEQYRRRKRVKISKEERQRSRKVGTLNKVGLICKKESVRRGMIKWLILNSAFLSAFINACIYLFAGILELSSDPRISTGCLCGDHS